METTKITGCRPPDIYFIDKSYDDENGHIHLPVIIPKIEGVPDIDMENDEIWSDIMDMYREKEFTGQFKVRYFKNEIKEYLFFYKR